jgi:putative transposase
MEFIQSINDNLEIIKELMKYKKFTKACIGLIRIKNSLIDILHKTKGKIKDLEIKKIAIETINRVKDTISLERAVHYFKITIRQYYNWSHQITVPCLETFIEQCPRIYPNQICKSEIKKMKEYFQNPAYKGWAIFSMAWEAIKKGDLYVGVGSWYKYAKILGFLKPLPENRRKNRIGIRAKRVAEKIHADTTIFRPLDNTRIYIYIIMDNRSRYIFTWKASLVSSGEIFAENLIQAYQRYLIPFYRGDPLELIVDGGPENNNLKVDEFLDDINGVIKKLIARKDILFSNSIIESVNKTLKYRHLFQYDIPDFESTVKHLEKAIPEYNNRPHYAHKGLTPREVLKGIKLDKEKIRNEFKEAYKRRIEENQVFKLR